MLSELQLCRTQDLVLIGALDFRSIHCLDLAQIGRGWDFKFSASWAQVLSHSWFQVLGQVLVFRLLKFGTSSWACSLLLVFVNRL